MAAAYTLKETEELLALWFENPSWEQVLKCAKYFHRTPRSIVAKLSKEGVYTKTGYLDKQGRRPVTKLHLVNAIEKALGLELPDLDKAPKETLRVLLEEIEDVMKKLDRINDLLENQEIARQMGIE